MEPPKVTKPLSAKELEQDADQAGIVSDEAVIDNEDTHLPSSESGLLADEKKHSKPMLEQNVAELPPG